MAAQYQRSTRFQKPFLLGLHTRFKYTITHRQTITLTKEHRYVEYGVLIKYTIFRMWIISDDVERFIWFLKCSVCRNWATSQHPWTYTFLFCFWKFWCYCWCKKRCAPFSEWKEKRCHHFHIQYFMQQNKQTNNSNSF